MSRISARFRKLGHTRWFARVGRALVPVDRALGKLTRGRYVAFGMRDVPSLLITTIGRTSGLARTNPLLYVPDGDAFAVVGSNWGQDRQPAWALNLIAHPDAVVTLKGAEISVRATLASGVERDRLWDLLLTMWPAYATYQARAANRDIMVFRLDRTATG
ncbi:MAG TPA: nitroreductase/quinone reductase family protein [Micromonosporaceae bacterium]|jgi:deazaflavin-dependent oxidoreductase (nitroreductase family)